MPFLSQTRFPRLWLAMQMAIGGNACKQAFATEHFDSQKKVLEIGCSVGNISEVFTSYPDVTFTGIDVDQQAINLAQHRFGHYRILISVCGLTRNWPMEGKFSITLFSRASYITLMTRRVWHF